MKERARKTRNDESSETTKWEIGSVQDTTDEGG